MKKILFFVVVFFSFVFGNTLPEILEAKEIRIGVWKYRPPFGNIENGKLSGFEIDLAKKIGLDIVGGTGTIRLVELENKNAIDRIKFLEENKVDLVIASFTKTLEREKILDFANPYIAINPSILIRKEDQKTLSILDSFADKKVAIKKGLSEYEELAKKYHMNIIYFGSTHDCYVALKDKDVDAVIGDNLIMLSYSVNDNSVVVPKNFQKIGSRPYYLAPAVLKGNTELLNKVNEILDNLNREKYFIKIYDDNFKFFYKKDISPKMFLLEDVYNVFGGKK